MKIINKQTIIIAISLLLGLVVTFCFSAAESHAEHLQTMQEHIAGEVLRLHVRANSNSDQDQQVKMEVKREIVNYLAPVLEDAYSVDQSKERIMNSRDGLQRHIMTALTEKGVSYGSSINLTKEQFPEKKYGDCTFPAGQYEALVVSLGEGTGDNWWCMLYPGLCFLDDTYAVVTKEKKEELKYLLTDEEYRWITDPDQVEMGFRWLPKLKELWG